MTISYDTAVKLREAGFPYGDVAYLTCPHGRFSASSKCGCRHDVLVYEPTLEELISAVGQPVCLDINHEERGCVAVRYGKDFPYRPEGRGKTAEEAFAHLWLSLHPKT